MRRFTKHTEPWGEFVDIKVNAVSLLRRKLASFKDKQSVVLLGSVTDAYQPLERKYELTRGLLKELQTSGCTVSILTKSDLILRDIDILRRFEHCTVGLTITTLDESVGAVLEPRAPSVVRRISALRKLHDSGISTYAFVGPILPFFAELGSIFRQVEGIVDEIWGEALNTRAGNWSGLEAALSRHFPQTVDAFKQQAKDRDFWDKTEREFRALCGEYGIPLAGFYRH